MATQNELRCFCRRKPLLALYGVDDKKRTFVHIKVFKQGKIFGESVYYGGEVKIRCRECYRWNNIVFRSASSAVLQETAPPPELDIAGTVGVPEPARQGSP